MGDPSGVGPEVTLKALANPDVKGLADFFIIGDRRVLAGACRLARCKPFINIVDVSEGRRQRFSYGRLTAEAGRASLRYIDTALEMISAGEADALVTAPINKSSIISSGIPEFQGHTEYLAERFAVKKFAMMFVGKKLKLTLVTRHVPFRDIPRILTTEKIYDAIILTCKALKEYFRIASPRICVCGLNPHAGENGAFGTEEKRIIAPAIRKAARSVKNIVGPVSADIAFCEALDGKHDAVIALYHDQGLIPFKMLYFYSGVNMTLGLPFVRTSPDHGTAFDIAGKGIANPESMIEAIRLACKLTKRPGKNQ